MRLAFIVLLLILAWFVFFNGVSYWWLLIPVVGFLALGPVQQRITDQRKRCERAAQLYKRGLARLDDNWSDKGATGDRFLDRSHPYAEDLDLFGTGSLFELLSTARTRIGEETLADWLLHAALPEVVRARRIQWLNFDKTGSPEDRHYLQKSIHTSADAKALTNWVTAPAWNISGVRVMAKVFTLARGLALWFAGYGWVSLLVAVLVGQTFVFGCVGQCCES